MSTISLAQAHDMGKSVNKRAKIWLALIMPNIWPVSEPHPSPACFHVPAG